MLPLCTPAALALERVVTMPCHWGVLTSPCALLSVHCTRTAPSQCPKLLSRPTCNRGQASGVPVVTWPSAALGVCGQHQEERHLPASSPAPTPDAAQRLGERSFHARRGQGVSCPHPLGLPVLQLKGQPHKHPRTRCCLCQRQPRMV